MAHRSPAYAFWLVVAIGLAGSPVARSAPILIGFDGVISASAGTPPGGPVPNGTPFTGTLAYDSSAPNSDPGVPRFLGLYLFDSPPSGLQISVGGSSYETDPGNVDFTIEIGPLRCIDVHTGFEVPCNALDPNQVLREDFDAVSESNVAIGGSDYAISLFQLLDPGDLPADPADFFQLPQSAEILAAQLAGSTVSITGSDFTISGNLTSAVAVPEPATGLLLALGLTALGVSRAARFRGRLP